MKINKVKLINKIVIIVTILVRDFNDVLFVKHKRATFHLINKSIFLTRDGKKHG